MNIYILASGSKGNATIVENNGHLILIDMGVSLSYLVDEMARYDLDVESIEAILLTHEHSDHIKGLRYLRNTPIFCTEETCPKGEINPLIPYQKTKIAGMEIRPISTSHDASNPVGYIIKDGKEKLVYVTDTGMIPNRSLRYMKNANYYVFESNHNQKMLHKTNRPALLKLRILSDMGHLCNEDAAMYLSMLVGDKTTDIVLAHISEEANTPELALKTLTKFFKKSHISLEKIHVQCAKQYESIFVRH